MSKVTHKVASFVKKIDPLAAKLTKHIDPGMRQLESEAAAGRDASQADYDAQAAYENSLNADNKTSAIASRDDVLRASASSAGATRSDNEADMLGFVQPGAKRKSASRTILG